MTSATDRRPSQSGANSERSARLEPGFHCRLSWWANALSNEQYFVERKGSTVWCLHCTPMIYDCQKLCEFAALRLQISVVTSFVSSLDKTSTVHFTCVLSQENGEKTTGTTLLHLIGWGNKLIILFLKNLFLMEDNFKSIMNILFTRAAINVNTQTTRYA